MNKWKSLAVMLALSGCAVTPESTRETEQQVTPQQALAPRDNHNSVIDEEVLYLLMAAELAGQRNQYDLAMDAYLQAAKRVGDARIAERAVKIGLFLKDEKRTREALSVWLSKDGQNLGARRFASLLAIRNGDQAAAVDNLEVILRDDPAGFEGGMLEMVKALEKDGRNRFIYDVLEELARRQPSQASVPFVQAVLASTLSDNDLAQQKIARALELQPDWSKALIFEAQLAGRAGDLVKARQYLEKAIKRLPEDRQLKKLLVEVMVNAGDFDDAIKYCQGMLEESPDDGDTQFMLSLIYLQQNQTDKAENHLEKLVNNSDWEGRAAFYLGKIEQDKQRQDKALKWFVRAEDAGHGFDAGMAALSILMNQKKFDEAESRIRQMDARYAEQHLKMMFAKAELLSQQGNHQASFDLLTEALKEVPGNRDVLYSRALVAEKMDKLDVMEADLHKILEKDPDDVGALNALGYSLVEKTQRYAEAETYLLKALSIQPDEAVVIDSYGWLLYKKGEHAKALELLKKAYATQAENEIAAHIVEVLWQMGRTSEAKEIFDAAYKKAPDDEYLLSVKKRLLTGD